jgi:hypothetical protein
MKILPRPWRWKYPAERLALVPAHHCFGFWKAIIDAETGRLLKYLPVDPYWPFSHPPAKTRRAR